MYPSQKTDANMESCLMVLHIVRARLDFVFTFYRRQIYSIRDDVRPIVTAESSKNDEEWNTWICNFVPAHGKRVFPHVSCANCIIPRESAERRELYVHAWVMEMCMYAVPRFGVVCITFPHPPVCRKVAYSSLETKRKQKYRRFPCFSTSEIFEILDTQILPNLQNSSLYNEEIEENYISIFFFFLEVECLSLLCFHD